MSFEPSQIFKCVGSGLLSVIGAYEVINAFVSASQSEISNVVGRVLAGVTASKLGVMWAGEDSEIPLSDSLVKHLFSLGAAVAASSAISNLGTSIQRLNVGQALKEIAQFTIGTAGAAYLTTLKTESVVNLYYIGAVSTVGYYASKSAYEDYKKGNYKNCLLKSVASAASAVAALYVMYSQFSPYILPQPPKEMLPIAAQEFLSDHQEEIDFMLTEKRAVGNWSFVGKGVTKKAFSHPDLPNYLLKIAKKPYREYKIPLHHKNLQDARSLIEKLDYKGLAVPQCTLLESPHGPYLIEERFQLTPYLDLADEYRDTKQNDQLNSLIACQHDLNAFSKKTSLCDIDLFSNHNVGVLKRTGGRNQIGLFDLDCSFKDIYEFGTAVIAGTMSWIGYHANALLTWTAPTVIQSNPRLSARQIVVGTIGVLASVCLGASISFRDIMIGLTRT